MSEKVGWSAALKALNAGAASVIQTGAGSLVSTLQIVEGLAIQGRMAELESRKDALTESAMKGQEQLTEMRAKLNRPQLTFRELQTEVLDL
jgi:hypothetical protein